MVTQSLELGGEMNLTELKENTQEAWKTMCDKGNCNNCEYNGNESCAEIYFAIDYLSSQGLLNLSGEVQKKEPTTVEDVELDFHKLEKVKVDVELGMPDTINEDLFFKELNERKSEFLKIKGR